MPAPNIAGKFANFGNEYWDELAHDQRQKVRVFRATPINNYYAGYVVYFGDQRTDIGENNALLAQCVLNDLWAEHGYD